MKKITLGRTKEDVSIISLGAWSHGKQNTSGGHNVGWSNQSDLDSINALKKYSNINSYIMKKSKRLLP